MTNSRPYLLLTSYPARVYGQISYALGDRHNIGQTCGYLSAERASGLAPPSLAWKANIMLLYDTRYLKDSQGRTRTNSIVFIIYRTSLQVTILKNPLKSNYISEAFTDLHQSNWLSLDP